MAPACVFCEGDAGRVAWRDRRCRVVVTDEPFPGFCRVIAHAHVREMTDLAPGDRTRMMDAVFATESALRELVKPDKVNLASLGNLVPHLHWHVIPRFADDSHFPQPVWGARQRDPAPRALPPDFEKRLGERLAASLGPSEPR